MQSEGRAAGCPALAQACRGTCRRVVGGGPGGAEQFPGLHLPPTPQEEAAAIARAQHFLESSVALVSDPYVSALTAYALTLLRSPVFPAALRKLRSLAITQRRCPPPATPAATVPGPPTAGPRKQLMSTCIE